MSEFGLPDLGQIDAVKDVCRKGCPEGRPKKAEASLRAEYEGQALDLADGIDPDLEAQAMGTPIPGEREATLRDCFANCEGPLRNRLGFGRAVCGMAINERREQILRARQNDGGSPA